MSGNGNGEHGVTHVPVDVLELTLTRMPWHLNIGGKVESNPIAIAMLRQALAYYEAKERQTYALQFMAEKQEEARIKAIADSVMNKKGG